MKNLRALKTVIGVAALSTLLVACGGDSGGKKKKSSSSSSSAQSSLVAATSSSADSSALALSSASVGSSVSSVSISSVVSSLSLSSVSSTSASAISISSSSSSSSLVNAHRVTVSSASNATEANLACNQASAPASCNLRIYQIMVESFVDGDASADYNAGYGQSHHKGDLQGIIDSLDYIESLGVNAIWMTPIFLSQPISGQDQWATRLDATGYFASNYFAVDPKFGTEEQLRELITTAHAKGMYVFLDGVLGHFKTNADDFLSPNSLQLSANGASQGSTGRQAMYPGDLEFFKEVVSYWIEEFKIDGWRLDQAYQVPIQYWDDLRAAVETASAATTYTNKDGATVHPLGYMVAEVWKGNSEIAAQAYGTNTNIALHSAFDFPLRYSLVQTLAVEESGTGKKGATQLNTGYESQLVYPNHAQPNLMLDNHDLVRFGDLLQRGNIANPADNEYWQRHRAAFSFMAAFSGPITLFYGDEIGQQLDGFAAQVTPCNGGLGNCDDHVSRISALIENVATTLGATPTVLTEQQSQLKAYVASLMNLREANPALYAGKRTHIFSNSNVYIDRKEHAEGNVLYILNTKAQPAVITLSTNAIGSTANLVDLVSSSVYSANAGSFVIELQPFESVFLDMGTAN